MIKYFEETIKTIKDCFKDVKEEEFNLIVGRCVEAIKNGGKIIASGLGKNVPICEKFVGTLNSFGIDARFLHTNTAIHGDLGIVGKKDIVFLLSKSGNTIETVILAGYLVARGCEIWCLTMNKDGEVCKAVNNKLVLNMANEGDLWDISPNNSTTIYLMLLQGIAIEMSKRMNITINDYKVNHPGGGIGQKLKDI